MVIVVHPCEVLPLAAKHGLRPERSPQQHLVVREWVALVDDVPAVLIPAFEIERAGARGVVVRVVREQEAEPRLDPDLRHDAAVLEAEQPLGLQQLGLDSLTSVELSIKLEDQLGVRPSAVELANGKSLQAICSGLLRSLVDSLPAA